MSLKVYVVGYQRTSYSMMYIVGNGNGITAVSHPNGYTNLSMGYDISFDTIENAYDYIEQVLMRHPMYPASRVPRFFIREAYIGQDCACEVSDEDYYDRVDEEDDDEPVLIPDGRFSRLGEIVEWVDNKPIVENKESKQASNRR